MIFVYDFLDILKRPLQSIRLLIYRLFIVCINMTYGRTGMFVERDWASFVLKRHYPICTGNCLDHTIHICPQATHEKHNFSLFKKRLLISLEPPPYAHIISCVCVLILTHVNIYISNSII